MIVFDVTNEENRSIARSAVDKVFSDFGIVDVDENQRQFMTDIYIGGMNAGALEIMGRLDAMRIIDAAKA